jgi:hypothetical protein
VRAGGLRSGARLLREAFRFRAGVPSRLPPDGEGAAGEAPEHPANSGR